MRQGLAAALCAAITAGVVLGSPPAGAAEWRVDPAGSRLGFAGTQAGSPFEGSFRRFTTSVRFDPSDLGQSKAVVVIDMTSAETGNGPRDEAVRSADWFNVETFPQGRFETTGFRALGGNGSEPDQLSRSVVDRPRSQSGSGRSPAFSMMY